MSHEQAARTGPWGRTRRKAREALHGILDAITDQMAKGQAVTIAGIGRFDARQARGSMVGGEWTVGHQYSGDAPQTTYTCGTTAKPYWQKSEKMVFTQTALLAGFLAGRRSAAAGGAMTIAALTTATAGGYSAEGACGSAGRGCLC